MNDVTIHDDGTCTVGAGTRLDRLYAALWSQGRTLPLGCGQDVGIAGLTLGGGVGLLGRRYGLTCLVLPLPAESLIGLHVDARGDLALVEWARDDAIRPAHSAALRTKVGGSAARFAVRRGR